MKGIKILKLIKIAYENRVKIINVISSAIKDILIIIDTVSMKLIRN